MYAALKVMVEEEEKSRPRKETRGAGLIGILEETNVAYEEAEEWYIGTTGEGVERAILST